MFTERLKEYREGLELTKKEMADKLGVSPAFYNYVENGKKSVSRNFMIKLVALTEMPEEYWLYGISEEDYIDVREDLKCTKKAIEQIVELGLVNNANDLFNGTYEKGTLEELLISALKADIDCKITKNKKNRSNKAN